MIWQKKTANYNLIKPLESEEYDVNIFNDNADTIDEVMERIECNILSIRKETKAATDDEVAEMLSEVFA